MEPPRGEAYPQLAPPINVRGSITGPGGAADANVPLDADVVFEGLAFTDVTGVLNYKDFELTAAAPARGAAGRRAAYPATPPPGGGPVRGPPRRATAGGVPAHAPRPHPP